MLTLKINKLTYEVGIEPDTPLLWVLRDTLGLMGTKFSCGIGECGACTVLVNGEPVRSCVYPLTSAQGQEITTIEGLSNNRDHPVQQAWIEEDVPQCGFCQPGQIMTAVALLSKNGKPSDADIEGAMTNICRCGTYQRIRKAIHRASELLD